MLTKQWNYNIIVQILHSSLRYTDGLLDVFFLSLAVILPELHKNQKGKIKLQKKVYRRKMICRSNFFMTEVPIIKKPVHWSEEQIISKIYTEL